MLGRGLPGDATWQPGLCGVPSELWEAVRGRGARYLDDGGGVQEEDLTDCPLIRHAEAR